jgi:hypothetical protein
MVIYRASHVFLLKNEVINLAPKFVIEVVFNKDTIA